MGKAIDIRVSERQQAVLEKWVRNKADTPYRLIEPRYALKVIPKKHNRAIRVEAQIRYGDHFVPGRDIRHRGKDSTVGDGACTISDNGDGSSTITCSDGTSVTVGGGNNSCSIAHHNNGTATITCDGTSVTVGGGNNSCPCGAADRRGRC